MTTTIARPVEATVRPVPPKTASRPPLDPAGTIVVTLLTIVTAIGLCRLFPDWAYLRQMVAVVIGAHAAATVMRFVRIPVYVALPLAALVVAELIVIVYYRETARFGLPTGDTIDFMRADFRLVWRQFPGAVAPVPSEGSFAMAASSLLGCCALLADAFAFRAFGRAEAVVPAGIVFVFTSALGTDRDRVVVSALWIGAAIVVIALLRHSHSRADTAWMGTQRRTLATVLPASLILASFAALAAGVVAPRLPGAGSQALLDTRNGGGDTLQVLSPLVDIRSRLINRRNLQVFTVKAAQPAYWRMAGLDEFDGTTWKASDSDLRSADGQLADRPDGTTLEQTFTFKRLGGSLVPAAYAAVAVGTPGLQWVESSQTLIKAGDGLQPDDVVTLTSVLLRPGADALRQASTDNAPSRSLYSLPSSFPAEVRDLAASVTAGAPTSYDKARALQDWFRANFTYDLKVQRGHGDDAIRNFLRIRRGYCEQFSATFAAMARTVGLPTRVAMGFTPGELQADGLYHVFDRHAHAWPEVWFDGVGWIAFEPTPGRGEPGAEATTGVGAAQDTSPDDGGGTTGGVAPIPSPPIVAPPRINEPTGTPTTAHSVTSTTVATVAGGDGSRSSAFAWIALLVAAIAGWVVLMPRVARRWSRSRPRSAQDRVVAAWRQACSTLRLAGAPAIGGSTPVEYARAVGAATGVDAHVIGEIARTVTAAVYSPAGVDAAAAIRCEQLRGQVDELCHTRIPLTTRILAHLDPRIARQLT